MIKRVIVTVEAEVVVIIALLAAVEVVPLTVLNLEDSFYSRGNKILSFREVALKFIRDLGTPASSTL